MNLNLIPSQEINISRDYSRAPAGRYRDDGPFNATTFRDDLLVPALQKAIATGTKVDVILDGVIGYSSSFLEEVFGGLARVTNIPDSQLNSSLNIVAVSRAYETAKRTAQTNLLAGLKARTKGVN
jgi:hypothetical protein